MKKLIVGLAMILGMGCGAEAPVEDAGTNDSDIVCNDGLVACTVIGARGVRNQVTGFSCEGRCCVPSSMVYMRSCPTDPYYSNIYLRCGNGLCIYWN